MSNKDRRIDDDDRELRAILKGINDIYTHIHPMLDNVHRDVHGIRPQFIAAIERSQTAIMNRLSVISAKIDNLTPSEGGDVVTDADKALMAASVVQLKAVVAKAKALDELTS